MSLTLAERMGIEARCFVFVHVSCAQCRHEQYHAVPVDSAMRWVNCGKCLEPIALSASLPASFRS